MNLYRSTINIAGCRRGETAEFPDTVRTAVLVSQGVLVPVVPSILERPDEFEAPATEIDGDVIVGDGTGEALPLIDQTGQDDATLLGHADDEEDVDLLDDDDLDEVDHGDIG